MIGYSIGGGSLLNERMQRFGIRQLIQPWPPSATRLVRRPFALDNGAYQCFVDNTPFRMDTFEALLDKYAADGPDFVVLPDIVGAGLRSLGFSIDWADKRAHHYSNPGIPFYLVLQDGMIPADLDPYIGSLDGLFLGGSIGWKHSTGEVWGAYAQRHRKPLHVGRCTANWAVKRAIEIGATSVDGNGPAFSLAQLERFATALAGTPQRLSAPNPLARSHLKKGKVGAYATTLEGDHGETFDVTVNPTYREFVKKIPSGVARGLVIGPDVFLWSAIDDTHESVAKKITPSRSPGRHHIWVKTRPSDKALYVIYEQGRYIGPNPIVEFFRSHPYFSALMQKTPVKLRTAEGWYLNEDAWTDLATGETTKDAVGAYLTSLPQQPAGHFDLYKNSSIREVLRDINPMGQVRCLLIGPDAILWHAGKEIHRRVAQQLTSLDLPATSMLAKLPLMLQFQPGELTIEADQEGHVHRSTAQLVEFLRGHPYFAGLLEKKVKIRLRTDEGPSIWAYLHAPDETVGALVDFEQIVPPVDGISSFLAMLAYLTPRDQRLFAADCVERAAQAYWDEFFDDLTLEDTIALIRAFAEKEWTGVDAEEYQAADKTRRRLYGVLDNDAREIRGEAAAAEAEDAGDALPMMRHAVILRAAAYAASDSSIEVRQAPHWAGDNGDSITIHEEEAWQRTRLIHYLRRAYDDAMKYHSELPALEGTDGQILLATLMRAQTMDSLHEIGRHAKTERDWGFINRVSGEIHETATSAADWIAMPSEWLRLLGPLQELVVRRGLPAQVILSQWARERHQQRSI